MEIIDFGLGWIDDGEEYPFVQALRAECGLRGLRFQKVDQANLKDVNGRVERGSLKFVFFLDLASEPHDVKNPFTRFVYSLKGSGSRVVADPDRVRSAADKSIAHFTLVDAGIRVPYTVVVRNWEPTRRLTEVERKGLGLPVVMKPALGYGQRGVRIFREWLSLHEMAEARSFDPGDNFLLQEFITPKDLGGHPGWFRVFFIFGEVTACWWNTESGQYRQVTMKELDRFSLVQLPRIVSGIATITGMEFFSCEIAVDRKTDGFIVIDYMNDQFDVSSQSQRAAGVPDDLLQLFVERLADKAWQYRIGRYPLSYRAMWFPRMRLKNESI